MTTGKYPGLVLLELGPVTIIDSPAVGFPDLGVRLTGQSVGSRLLIIIPTKGLSASDHIPPAVKNAGALVFVVDILDAANPSRAS